VLLHLDSLTFGRVATTGRRQTRPRNPDPRSPPENPFPTSISLSPMHIHSLGSPPAQSVIPESRSRQCCSSDFHAIVVSLHQRFNCILQFKHRQPFQARFLLDRHFRSATAATTRNQKLGHDLPACLVPTLSRSRSGTWFVL
jgi:hypothetical protein